MAEDAAPWGKAVEGVQVRLRADKLRWNAGEAALPADETDLDALAERLAEQIGGTWKVRRVLIPDIGNVLSGDVPLGDAQVRYLVFPFPLDEAGRAKLGAYANATARPPGILGSNQRCTVLTHSPRAPGHGPVMRTLGLAPAAVSLEDVRQTFNWNRMWEGIRSVCAEEGKRRPALAVLPAGAVRNQGNKELAGWKYQSNAKLDWDQPVVSAQRKDPDKPYYYVRLSVQPMHSGPSDVPADDPSIVWDGTSSQRRCRVKWLGVAIGITVLSDDAEFVKAIHAILDQEVSRALKQCALLAGQSAQWGPGVEGVQVRLRADKLRWNAGETPTLLLDVANGGTCAISIMRTAYQNCCIEIDGRRYGWAEPIAVVRPGTVPVEVLKAGAQTEKPVEVALGPQWGLVAETKSRTKLAFPETGAPRLQLAPGRHTVRVVFQGSQYIADPTVNTPRVLVPMVISNAVEIEIVAEEKPEPAPRGGKVSVEEAERLVREYIFRVKPTMNPEAQFRLLASTPAEVWDRLGAQVLKVNSRLGPYQGVTFLIRKGQVVRLGVGEGGMDITPMCTADLDADGKPELLYAHAVGSGIHRTRLGMVRIGPDGKLVREDMGCIYYWGNFEPRRVDDQTVQLVETPWLDKGRLERVLATVRYDRAVAQVTVTAADGLDAKASKNLRIKPRLLLPVAKVSAQEAERLVREQAFRMAPMMNPDAPFRLLASTPAEVWDRLGSQVFLVDPEFAAYQGVFLIHRGQVVRLGVGDSGMSITPMCVADLDGDGKPELLYAHAVGSGKHHRTRLGRVRIGPDGRPVREDMGCDYFRGGFGPRRVNDQTVQLVETRRDENFPPEGKPGRVLAAVRYNADIAWVTVTAGEGLDAEVRKDLKIEPRRLLPGSRASLEEATRGGYKFVAVCEALDIGAFETSRIGWFSGTQQFKVIEMLSGAKPGGEKIRVRYEYVEPDRGERAVRRGERVIWVARKDEGMDGFSGVKALADTPANRAAVAKLVGKDAGAAPPLDLDDAAKRPVSYTHLRAHET